MSFAQLLVGFRPNVMGNTHWVQVPKSVAYFAEHYCDFCCRITNEVLPGQGGMRERGKSGEKGDSVRQGRRVTV